MAESINKRFKLGQHDNYDSLTQFAFPSWVGNNTNFGYGQQMVGPNIIDAGQQSNPVINHVLRGKPYSPELNFVKNIPKYAYMFAVNMSTSSSIMRRENTPNMLLSLEQLNYVLHYLQLEQERTRKGEPIDLNWLHKHVTYVGVNNTDRSSLYATGRERDFTILSTGTTYITNIFKKNKRDLIGGDRLWLIARRQCCMVPQSYMPDDVDGGVIMLAPTTSRMIVRISAIAGPPEYRTVPLVCSRCDKGINPFDCACQLRVMYKIVDYTDVTKPKEMYEHAHVFRVGEVDISREKHSSREIYPDSETNMLKFNMNRRIMAVLNT